MAFGVNRGGLRQYGRVSSEQHPLLPYLVRLEQPNDPEAEPTMPTNDVLRFALGWIGSDYWPERAVEWLGAGVSAEALQTELKGLVVDPKPSQRLRLRAMRFIDRPPGPSSA
jgi:hypothetical protein